jgi:hypothetical protein
VRSRLGLRFELVDEGCGDDNFLQTDFTGWILSGPVRPFQMRRIEGQEEREHGARLTLL